MDKSHYVVISVASTLSTWPLRGYRALEPVFKPIFEIKIAEKKFLDIKNQGAQLA